MSEEATKLLEVVLKLPMADRADIASRLNASLSDEGPQGLHPAWDAEIKRRIEAIEAGADKLLTWPEARARMFGHE
jgi:putative addiction module component (TIGR02574 family)